MQMSGTTRRRTHALEDGKAPDAADNEQLDAVQKTYTGRTTHTSSTTRSKMEQFLNLLLQINHSTLNSQRQQTSTEKASAATLLSHTNPAIRQPTSQYTPEAKSVLRIKLAVTTAD